MSASASVQNPYRKSFAGCFGASRTRPIIRNFATDMNTSAEMANKTVLIKFKTSLHHFAPLKRKEAWEVPINNTWKQFFVNLGQISRTTDDKLFDNLVIYGKTPLGNDAPPRKRISSMNQTVYHFMHQYRRRPAKLSVQIMPRHEADEDGRKTRRRPETTYSRNDGRSRPQEPTRHVPPVSISDKAPYLKRSRQNPGPPPAQTIRAGAPSVVNRTPPPAPIGLRIGVRGLSERPRSSQRPGAPRVFDFKGEEEDDDDDAMSQISFVSNKKRKPGEDSTVSHAHFMRILTGVSNADWLKSRNEIWFISREPEFPRINKKMPILMANLLLIFGTQPQKVPGTEGGNPFSMTDDDDDDDGISQVSMDDGAEEETNGENVAKKVVAHFKNKVTSASLVEIRGELRNCAGNVRVFVSLNKRMPILVGILVRIFGIRD